MDGDAGVRKDATFMTHAAKFRVPIRHAEALSTVIHAQNQRARAQRAGMEQVSILLPAGDQTAGEGLLGQVDRSATAELAAALHDEPAATLELSQDAMNRLRGMPVPGEARAKAASIGQGGSPPDETRRLLRQLVSAKSQDEVRNVMSEAYKSLIGWYMASGSGDKNATAVIRQLNRLISRANRKIRDLNKEDDLQHRHKRAEKADQEHLERKLREELLRARLERRQREQRYLHDPDPKRSNAPPVAGVPSIAKLEAKIRALSVALAQLSSSSPTGGDPAAGGMAAADLAGGAALVPGDVASAEV